MTAEQAIERSVSHNEIVSVAWSADLADSLSKQCEDSVEANGVTEYWGTTESGAEWRVHLTGVTAQQLQQLRREAKRAGDLAQVAVCDAALAGDVDATRECIEALDAARAMVGT